MCGCKDNFMFCNKKNIGFAQISKWKRQIVSSAAVVQEAAEVIASYQKLQYCIAANIVENFPSILPLPPVLLLCLCLLADLKMQLLRFSYFSKFEYYIGVLKYSEEV